MILRSFLLGIIMITGLYLKAQPGTVDYSFKTDFNCNAIFRDNSVMRSAGVQSDGKIVVGGFCRINFIFGNEQSNLFRLFPDGSLDTSFKVGNGTGGDLSYVGVMPDDKVLISGNITEINKIKCKQTTMLFPDGRIDSSFHYNLFKYVDRVYTPVIQPDGKILIWGFRGTKSILLRVRPNGLMDSSFKPNNFNKIIFNGKDVFLMGDGSVLHRRIDSTGTKAVLLKINANGEINTGFNLDPNIEIYSTLDAKSMPNGKILLAGDFLFKNENVRKNFIRLNPDGTHDNTFMWFNIFEGTVAFQMNSILIQDDGKILSAGFVSNIGDKKNVSVIRFNGDGSLDNTFELIEGNANKEFAQFLIPYDDDRVLITGTFTEYNSLFTSRIARIFIKNLSKDLNLSIGPNPSTGIYNIKSNTEILSIRVYDYLGQELLQYLPNEKKTILDLSAESAGVYFIKIGTNRGSKTVKVINQ